MLVSKQLANTCARVRISAVAMLYLATLPLNAQILTKDDLQKEIATYEAEARQTDTSNVPAVQAGRIWSHLATLYQDAGRYGQSELAFERAMRTLTIAPVSKRDLAATIDDLGTLHLEMGNVKEAEREESNALKIREQTGLSSDLSRSWYHLAVLYLREHRSQKAKEFAERAVDALLANSSAAPEDRIGSLFVLGAILCQSHAYPQAIAKIQSALEIANATYGSEKFPTGLGAFLLGYVDWKNGDSASADKLMRRGTEILSKELGWEHPAYLCVMAQYARFLRAERRHDLARAVEQQVKSMRAHLSSNPAYGRNSQINDVMALF